MRDPYICPYCDQCSTRRWNLDVHIKRRHGGYLLGESSGRHIAIDPFWYKPNNPYHNIGSATAANGVGNTFEPGYLRQQAHLGISQYSPSRPMPSMNDQKYGPGLFRDKILKIEELKRLMSKHSQYHENPDGVIRLAVYNSVKGDDTLLDEKLGQLRSIDSTMGYHRM
jgi:hypothetical protein